MASAESLYVARLRLIHRGLNDRQSKTAEYLKRSEKSKLADRH